MIIFGILACLLVLCLQATAGPTASRKCTDGAGMLTSRMAVYEGAFQMASPGAKAGCLCRIAPHIPAVVAGLYHGQGTLQHRTAASTVAVLSRANPMGKEYCVGLTVQSTAAIL